MSYQYATLTENEIIDRLDRACQKEADIPYPQGLIAKTFRPASVLVPLLQLDNLWQVLFIRRTDNQHDQHSGQVAFPGGASDPVDSNPEATALRETQEEIGLDPNDVYILGRLNDFITISSYQVTPIVARIPWPYPFRLASEEVSRIFTIPLDWLANISNHETRQRKLPKPYDPISVIYFKAYDGEILWGASARFTLGLLEALFSSDPC